jgi:membrane protein YqaA with SNARE-associated domain
MGFWDQLIDALSQYEADPAVYLLLFFVFCVLAAVILPIPIEIFLVIDPSVPFALKALVMGLGKGTGAIAVFFIGAKVESAIMRFSRWGWFKWLLDKSEAFVRRFGSLALYVIMSIPGMVDTIPLYLFSILNKEGQLMTLRDFTVANILAGINRAMLIYTLFFVFGIKLFG